MIIVSDTLENTENSWNLTCLSKYYYTCQVTLANESVKARGLVVEEVKYKDVIAEHKRYWQSGNSTKNFRGISLGYVTPVGSTHSLQRR